MGYLRYEDPKIIVYYKPHKRKEMIHDDITFCKKLGKIIFYQGSNYGSDAYRMDYRLIKALKHQCDALGWKFDEGEESDELQRETETI